MSNKPIERLIVKDFAGIKELDIEVRRINILIGPQASGKSICAKLLFYFKGFVWEILSAVENDLNKHNLDLNYLRKFEEFFPSVSWGSLDFLVRYETYSKQGSDIFIEVTKARGARHKICIRYSEIFEKGFTSSKNYIKRRSKDILGEKSEYQNFEELYEEFYIARILSREAMLKFLRESLYKETTFSQLFIPAGRSFFAALESNIFSFLSSNKTLDPFLRSFGSIYETTKGLTFREVRPDADPQSPEQRDALDAVNKLVEETLCGKHIRVKGEDFLEMRDGRRISLANSSSGQQETLPLTIMLTMLPSLSPSSNGQTVYIEEPEAHLFPNAQRNIVELIATVFNYRSEQLQFFITTHSPYILTAMNNLLQAGLLYRKSSLDILPELSKIVPSYKALNPSILSAYALSDGGYRSIICPDTGLIDAGAIDEVSNDLAIEFDRLLDLG